MNRELLNLFKRAEEAGMAAGMAFNPTPMVVVQRANPLDDNSPIVKQYEPVMDGVCGFAYINFIPGNSKIANAAKKRYGHTRDDDWRTGRQMNRALAEKVGIGEVFKRYYGGLQASIWAFNQSYERKMAFAEAYVKVFREAGYDVVSYEGRLD